MTKSDDPLRGTTPERLRKIIKSLSPERKREPTYRERVEQARVRIAAREEAEARLRQIESARIGHEVYEEPNIRAGLDRRIGNAVATVELRQHLRGEPVPLAESASPAHAALATSADERQHKMVWSQFNPNGWGSPDDDA